MLETLNEFYDDMLRKESTAKIIDIRDNKIYLDKTIFYAESGGQESDQGMIKKDDNILTVNSVQYEKGSQIWKTAHYISTDVELNEIVNINDDVILSINLERRKKLSAYHTASHLLFIAVELVRPEIQKKVIGCHIKEESARFDFMTDIKFSEDELLNIQENINKMIVREIEINTYYTSEGKNERGWQCDGVEIPCGGTHLKNTRDLSFLNVKRKGIGKGKERLICFAEYILKGESCV